MEDCIFCKVVSGELKSGGLIYENDNFMGVYNVSPEVKGHAVVISKKHFENVLDLPSSMGSELMDCIKKTSVKIMAEHKAEGINLHSNNFKVAGQLINHFHIHVIPRKEGDCFKPCA